MLQNCRHNTEGARCERCKAGFYGDATSGQADDCRRCACPLTLPTNNFSPTYYLASNGLPVCDACQPGYSGQTCDRCAAGFVGNPSLPGDRCVRDDGGRYELEVSPKRATVLVGGTISISCSAGSRRGEVVATITWSLASGDRLPEGWSPLLMFQFHFETLLSSSQVDRECRLTGGLRFSMRSCPMEVATSAARRRPRSCR